jgi:hypothetical protein
MIVKCYHCGFAFEEYPNGEDRYVVYEDSEQRSLSCPKCGKTFLVRSDFEQPEGETE